jgi:hypothetical protein
VLPECDAAAAERCTRLPVLSLERKDLAAGRCRDRGADAWRFSTMRCRSDALPFVDRNAAQVGEVPLTPAGLLVQTDSQSRFRYYLMGEEGIGRMKPAQARIAK